LQKNASIHYVAARLFHAKAEALDAMAIEPPPTFPFRKSQCQTARQNDVFTPLFNETPLAQRTLREAAWARVIGAASPQVKRKNRGKSAFFQAVVDGLFAADLAASR